MLDPNRNYRRIEIEDVFKQAKKRMQEQAVKRGEAAGYGKRAYYTDVFTGKMLLGGDKYEYDHIVPAEKVYEMFKGEFTDNEIAILANIDENIGTTLTDINRAKGKKTMEELLQLHPEKCIRLGVDATMALSVSKNALAAMQEMAKVLKNKR